MVNGEILDIYSYMSVHLSEIIKDCKPSCVPNPCQNNAVCKELWLTYQCVCKNPWAHLGENCEISMQKFYSLDLNYSTVFLINYSRYKYKSIDIHITKFIFEKELPFF